MNRHWTRSGAVTVSTCPGWWCSLADGAPIEEMQAEPADKSMSQRSTPLAGSGPLSAGCRAGVLVRVRADVIPILGNEQAPARRANVLSLANPVSSTAKAAALCAMRRDPRVGTHVPSLRHTSMEQTRAVVHRWMAGWGLRLPAQALAGAPVRTRRKIQ